MTGILYIIQGFLGAGKTTWSTAFSRQTAAARLNADEWCDAHFTPAQLSAGWDECFASAVSTLWEDAETLLKDGRDVILDFGFWSKASRDHARGKAAALGVKCTHYYIFAPDDVLLERLRKRSGGIAARNLENFHALKKFFEEPSADENAVLIRNYKL